MKYIKMLIAVILLIALDQITKIAVYTNLKPIGKIPLIEGVLSLTYLENRGAAWGIMQGQIPLLSIITIIVVLLIFFFYGKIPDEKKYIWYRLTMTLITAGAIGNLIDRVIRTFVVDFIYFELIDFPIFNVADIYVTCGAAILIFATMFIYKDEEDYSFISFKSNKSKNGSETKN